MKIKLGSRTEWHTNDANEARNGMTSLYYLFSLDLFAILHLVFLIFNACQSDFNLNLKIGNNNCVILHIPAVNFIFIFIE